MKSNKKEMIKSQVEVNISNYKKIVNDRQLVLSNINEYPEEQLIETYEILFKKKPKKNDINYLIKKLEKHLLNEITYNKIWLKESEKRLEKMK